MRLASILSGLIWVAGVVLAKGFWSTFAAVFLPPWAWYLVVERVGQSLGWW
jgi:hypothetical protein